MQSKYRRWTKEEDDLLVKIYNKFSNKELQGIFNRSPFKVARRAGKLGIKKDKKVQYANLSRTLIKEGTNKGRRNPGWKGGRRIDSNGYVFIHKPEHPRANVDGYVFEHRLVMESVIGRYLKKNEISHHINGNRSDNRKENLLLVENNSIHQKRYHLKTLRKNFAKSPSHMKHSYLKKISASQC